MDRFLDVVSAGREADVRRMVISTAGTGERSLFVSYISEVPMWKTTYRIVLRPKARPLLQGWAIVDNTVGEDWDQRAVVAGGRSAALVHAESVATILFAPAGGAAAGEPWRWRRRPTRRRLVPGAGSRGGSGSRPDRARPWST